MHIPHSDIDQLDHDPELACALGNVIVAWSRAETSLINVFAMVAGVEFNMATIAYYRIPSFEARCKFIQALLEAWPLQPTTRRDELAKHVQKLRNLAAARNDWVHGLWCVDKDYKSTVIFDFRQPDGTQGRRRVVKAHDLLDHAAAVRRRTEKIDDLVPLKIDKPPQRKRKP